MRTLFPYTTLFRSFLLEYHADADFALDPAPLAIAAEALVKAGGVEARRAAVYVADDPRTLAPLARQLRTALQASREHKEGEIDRAEHERAPAADPGPNADPGQNNEPNKEKDKDREEPRGATEKPQ